MSDNVIVLALALTVVVGVPLALFALQRRFGSVRIYVAGLGKDDIERVKAAYESYNAGRVRRKPERPRSYRKGIFTDYCITLYSNGIFAKFCVGPVCKYRFVPFGEISGIYPIKIQGWMPHTAIRQPRDGLQIETIDKMTFIVDPASHDLADLIDAMKKAMLGAWERVYQPDELLWTKFGSGEAHVHHMIRSERPATEAARILEAVQSPTPRIAGKGALLLEQSEVDLAPAKARFRRIAAYSAIGAPAMFVAAWFLLSAGIAASWATYPLCILPTALAVLGFLLAVLAPVALISARTMTPARIYENGIEAPYYGGKPVFRSWGEFVNISEESLSFRGETYHFEAAVYGNDVLLPKNTHGLASLMPEIEKKVGKAENVFVLEKPQHVESRVNEYLLYGGALIVAAIFSAFIDWSAYRTYHYLVWITGFGLVFPPTAIIMVTLAANIVKNLGKKAPRRFRMKLPAAIVGTILVYFFMSAAYDTTIEPYYIPSPNLEPEPATSSIPAGVYENSTMNVTGFIFVRAGETLVFRNSRLTMNLSSAKQSGIRVAEGGTLMLENVTLNSSSQYRGYTFEILGSAAITDSNITGLWGDMAVESTDGGLEIYSSGVTLSNVHIWNVITNGVLITDASPVISDSVIEQAGNAGIVMHHSDAVVTNNTIRSCYYPIAMGEGSGPAIKGNYIADNFKALSVNTSHPTIERNSFVSLYGPAIEYDFYSKPVIADNSYVVAGSSVVQTSSPTETLYCDVFVVVIAIIAIAYLYRFWKDSIRMEHARLNVEGTRNP